MCPRCNGGGSNETALPCAACPGGCWSCEACAGDGFTVTTCPCSRCEGAGGVDCLLCHAVPNRAALSLFGHIAAGLLDGRLVSAGLRVVAIEHTLRLTGGDLTVLGVMDLLATMGLAPDRALALLRAPGPHRPINAPALWASVLVQLEDERAHNHANNTTGRYACLSS